MAVVSIRPACTSLIGSSLAAFTVQALSPGNSYPGPSGNDDTNLCMCNTVVYSLMSACDGCQGETWITYDPPHHFKFFFLNLSLDGPIG